MSAPALTINASILEGLFVRALKVSGPFAAELKSAGIDVANLAPEYPSETFGRALEIAARHVCPGMPFPEAQRELGRRFTAGFLETIVGSIMGAALSFMGPEAVIRRMPKNMTVSRKDVKAAVEKLGPSRWRLAVEAPRMFPYFTAGAFEAALKRSGVKPQVTVLAPDGDHFELTFSW